MRIDGTGKSESCRANGVPMALAAHSAPEVRYTAGEWPAEGDRAAVRRSWRGTQREAGQAFLATHRELASTGRATFELRDGKRVRGMVETDRPGFLQAIGAVPSVTRPASQPRRRR